MGPGTSSTQEDCITERRVRKYNYYTVFIIDMGQFYCEEYNLTCHLFLLKKRELGLVNKFCLSLWNVYYVACT